MADWAPKRFWTEAVVVAVDGGHTVHLDTRPVKTPAKAPLVLPTAAMAAAVAAEWQAQVTKIDPETMPCTRAANSAIDKLTHQHGAVVDMLAAYGGSDLLCYRATRPDGLIARQAQLWDPLLDWAADRFGARLAVTSGIMPKAQDGAALARLQAEVAALDRFELAAFHDLVALSGSLVIALAVIHDHLPQDAAWDISRVDEDWQISEWGADEDAAALTAVKRAAFLQAGRFYGLCR